MDQDLIAYLGERFEALDRKIDERFETFGRNIDERFETFGRSIDERFEKVEGAIRQTGVSVEGVRGEVQLLAEGVIGLEEKLQSLRGEVTLRLDQVQGSLTHYYTTLDSHHSSLDRRVHLLEERAQREGQAPLDYIRERYGKPKTSAYSQPEDREPPTPL